MKQRMWFSLNFPLKMTEILFSMLEGLRPQLTRNLNLLIIYKCLYAEGSSNYVFNVIGILTIEG